MGGLDTIVAVSSGPGVAGVAVLRVSGAGSRQVLTSLGARLIRPRHAELVALREPRTGLALDQALTLFFPGPHSFTGEDVAEFHVHGGRAVQAAVIDAILAVSPSVRLAEAGEFTRRALDNGKLDLSQVEGLAALIDSETEWQRKQALRLMSGELSQLALEWRIALIGALSCLDAGLDFADEGDVVDAALIAQVPLLIGPVVAQLKTLIAGAPAGERLRGGFRVVIAGPPNAGKSSLLNAIAKRDVAIVSHLAGTTRDIIEVRCDLGGLPVTFLDTAGLRDSDDTIEIAGMERTHRAIADADLVLNLAASDSVTERLSFEDVNQILIVTKIDLVDGCADAVPLSTLNGHGVSELLDQIREELSGLMVGEPGMITERRQSQMLREALRNLVSADEKLANDGLQVELLAEDIRLACLALDQLIGRVNVDDVLDQIFSRFCIGK